MPKLKPETLQKRRQHILDCAEQRFAEAGFHRTTMHDICDSAGISAGALYSHFRSKEDLIAGIAERDRAELGQNIERLTQHPDLIEAFGEMARHYLVREPRRRSIMAMEIIVESTRNREVAETARDVDETLIQELTRALQQATSEGRINPRHDPATIAILISILGDGCFWRRALDPGFDAEKVLPAILEMIGQLVSPQDTAPSASDIGETGADKPTATTRTLGTQGR